MTVAAEFNLVDEPWIRVRQLGGGVTDVSLRELFEQAETLAALAGEIPTQDAAILRALEAVVLGAVRPTRRRTQLENEDLFAGWWAAGNVPVDDVVAYLERHRDRFYLFHPVSPFLQVAGLHTASGNASGLVKLIADVPDGHQYFTTRAGRELESLSYAEAARWLVHCQAFDPSGIKTGAVGDDRVKGGRGYPLGYPAWAGNLGLLFLRGANLAETLLLNLPLTLTHPDDLPVWERPPLGPGVAVDHPAPLGPADSFTWPSRRVRLIPDAGRVVDVQISNGDRLGPQNLMGVEPMTSWKKSDNQSKGGHVVYMPVRQVPERRVWQGLGSLLLSVGGSAMRAPVLEWIDGLRALDIIEPARRVELRVVGIEYGAQASSIAGAVDDGVSAHVAALVDEVLVVASADAAARASAGVVALARLASDLAEAAGGERERPRAAAYELGYSRLDGPFRRWLTTLLDPAEAPNAVEAWGQEALLLLQDLGSRMVVDAGASALVGREVTHNKKAVWLDSATAERWFRYQLRKDLLNPSVREAEEATP